MKNLNIPEDDRVLVGSSTSDDAGVYKIDKNTALVQTVDFITPIVDDPFIFGQIAVCNSLSDIYAMGGKPLTALNIVCFPTKKFSLDRLSSILEGGLSVLNKNGIQLLGGHSIDDEELKYGLSVTGLIDPKNIIRNTGISDGDKLILTKPIGTGIISTALKAGIADEEIIGPYIKSMSMLNNIVPELMDKYNLKACTDITGFGLAGHLNEMIGNSNFEVNVYSDKISVLKGAIENAKMGIIPAGLYRNRDYLEGLYELEENLEQVMKDLFFDPQTSGGLLIAAPGKECNKLLEEIKSMGFSEASIIGEVSAGKRKKIILK